MSSTMSRSFTDWTCIDRSCGNRSGRRNPPNEQDTPVSSVTWSPWGWVCGGEEGGRAGGKEGKGMGDGGIPGLGLGHTQKEHSILDRFWVSKTMILGKIWYLG